ncbi:hypothetical protein CYY_004426 [Polysphondylium violaceum]|uniref:Uncharacterized protein n=1 Tax=Polysphondylium violaceum TaxID=133409 RepID=A0A8J4V547_9MYCE|nr:hypothetical protein CYY_004426 [Polysphondylium violaceum]
MSSTLSPLHLESKNFYGWYSSKDDHSFILMEKKERDVNLIEPKSFWLVFNDPFLNRSIWKNVRKLYVPFQKYENIHSMKWIFRNGSMQLLIDKVKRDEYLSDIPFVSNQLDQFKLINDLEFYSIFNRKYKRYLLSPQMENVNQFLDSILNNNNSNESSEDDIQNKSIFNKWFYSNTKNDNQDIKGPEEMSENELLEHYKLKMELNLFQDFRRALESKHFQIGKYVLDEWLYKACQPFGEDIRIGNKDILEYYCIKNKDNKKKLTISVSNLYHRDDFEECMKLLENSGNIDKNNPTHMNRFKTKRNLIYFLNNEYQYNNYIFYYISKGTMEQLCCVSMILESGGPRGAHYTLDRPEIFNRLYILVQQINLSMDELTKQFPDVAKEYTEYLNQYHLLYIKDFAPDDTTCYPSIVELSKIAKHGNIQTIKQIIESFIEWESFGIEAISSNTLTPFDYSGHTGITSYPPSTSIGALISGAASGNHLNVIKMIFHDYPRIREKFLLNHRQCINLLHHAIHHQNLEMLDYLLDQLNIVCPPSQGILNICQNNSIILSYFLSKPRKNNTPYVELEDFKNFYSRAKDCSVEFKLYQM